MFEKQLVHPFHHQTSLIFLFRLDENMKVVIADFGLSRNVQQSDDGMYVPTNVQNVPFRWLAPECLVNNQYSTKSDVVCMPEF
jgi:serine/threonine protein kinase